MARPIAQPLRPLRATERQQLMQVTKSPSQALRRHRRARALLAVANGATLTAAAKEVGWRVCDTVAALIRRFNAYGLEALDDRPRSGRRRSHGPVERERILREFHREPDLERDGTATWSLSTLRRALRAIPDGLPNVSTFTILHVLHEAGYSWQQNCSWCETGIALRKNKKEGTVERVVDPEAEQKRG
jgi:transposase